MKTEPKCIHITILFFLLISGKTIIQIKKKKKYERMIEIQELSKMHNAGAVLHYSTHWSRIHNYIICLF